jgi:hypothetical protein
MFITPCSLLVLQLYIIDGFLDGFFCQHRAVQFDRGQVEVVGNIAVLDLQGLFHTHSLDELSRVGT